MAQWRGMLLDLHRGVPAFSQCSGHLRGVHFSPTYGSHRHTQSPVSMRSARVTIVRTLGGNHDVRTEGTCPGDDWSLSVKHCRMIV
jgi:hypothetical protein